MDKEINEQEFVEQSEPVEQEPELKRLDTGDDVWYTLNVRSVKDSVTFSKYSEVVEELEKFNTIFEKEGTRLDLNIFSDIELLDFADEVVVYKQGDTEISVKKHEPVVYKIIFEKEDGRQVNTFFNFFEVRLIFEKTIGPSGNAEHYERVFLKTELEFDKEYLVFESDEFKLYFLMTKEIANDE